MNRTTAIRAPRAPLASSWCGLGGEVSAARAEIEPRRLRWLPSVDHSSPRRRARASSARCRRRSPSARRNGNRTSCRRRLRESPSNPTVEEHPSEYLESIDDKTEALIRDVERRQQDASRRARNLATNTKALKHGHSILRFRLRRDALRFPKEELHLRRRHSPRKLDQLGEVYRARDRQHVGDLEFEDFHNFCALPARSAEPSSRHCRWREKLHKRDTEGVRQLDELSVSADSADVQSALFDGIDASVSAAPGRKRCVPVSHSRHF